jgi:transcriptional regulator with XRE-family HTH domain
MPARPDRRTPRTTPPDAAAEPTTAERTPLAGLGAEIRRRRKERGLTLVQLARLAELSHPFLSQLERGLTHPSMQSLHRIAQALGTTQQALMVATAVTHPDTPAGSVHLVRADEGMPVANRGGTARMLGAAPYAMHPVAYQGASEDFREYYDHPGDEFLYLLDGEIEIDLQTLDGPRLHQLSPGDSIFYPGGTPHRWRALGEPGRVRVLTVQSTPGTTSVPHA